MKPGSAAKVDYQYSRRGTCCVLAAVEPRAGRRRVEVHRHRGKREYASFMRRLAAKYPEAQRIILMQDNLNTHGPGCFYEFYPANEARELAKRFEIHFTPKKASWLNMAEIELSVMSKQCFARRIGSIQELRHSRRGVGEEAQQGAGEDRVAVHDRQSPRQASKTLRCCSELDGRRTRSFTPRASVSPASRIQRQLRKLWLLRN